MHDTDVAASPELRPLDFAGIGTVPYLDANAVEELLPLTELIPAVGNAFADDSLRPERMTLNRGAVDWIVMPALGRQAFVCKIVRVGPSLGGPTVAGLVVVLDPDGSLICLLDAASFTARRTAAVAAFATNRMARPDASVLALYGAGALALPHVEAISAVRTLREVRVVSRSRTSADHLAARLRDRDFDARAIDAATAPVGADLIVTVTTSHEAVLPDHVVAPGTHINAMGSYRPERREIPAETLARARIAVETGEAAWREAGDLIQARDEGFINETHVVAELATDGLDQVRLAPTDITVFKSVGDAAFDNAAANVILRQISGCGESPDDA